MQAVVSKTTFKLEWADLSHNGAALDIHPGKGSAHD